MPDEENYILIGNDAELEQLITQFAALRHFLANKNFGTVYGIPAESYQETFTFKPQVKLYFRQPVNEVPAGGRRKYDEHGFRLIGKESETIVLADVEALAARIRSLFGGASPFFYQTGKNRATYTEKAKGYELKINCYDKANGRKVVEQMLDITSHSPDWKFFNFIQNEDPTDRYDETPGSVTILGERYKRPVRRRIAKVEFYQATLALHGKSEQILLYPQLIVT